ncbi:MAG: transposase [Candidatus Eisenbacteria bacterium]
MIDLSDITKQYARSMEYLARVRDGSTGELTNGYWTVKVIGSELDEVKVTPLYEHLYSQRAPGFVSENDEIMQAITLVSSHMHGRGIWVMDRGGDRHRLYRPLLEDDLRFLIRQRGDRDLLWRGRRVLVRELASLCPILYAERLVRETDGKEKVCTIEYGYMRVRLPGRPEQLTLVVVWGFGQEPLMLLTNVKVRRSRKSVSFIVHSYLRRWQIEDTIRCSKQSYELENVRLLSYGRLQNMMVLALCAMYFSAVHLGDGIRLKVLMYRALTAAKRLFGIPDFRYYALADGIKALLEGFSKPFVARQVSRQPPVQTNLFDP